MKHKKLFLIGLISAISFAQSACAYEMQAKLDRAMVEYNNNNVGKAADILTEVSDYLRAAKAETLSKLLPDAPDGWSSDSTNSGSSLMGGSQTRATYAKGDEQVLVSYMTDNKLVGSMLTLLNQTSAATPDGLKMYNGYIRTFEKVAENDQLVFNLYVSENLVISVKGKTLTEDTAALFINKIDLVKLKTEAEK